MISFIVAMDENRVIGKNNELPWHLPEDLKYFKRVTMGHPIIMGRKTFESIGRPLPGRENIIITRNKEFQTDKCTVINSVEELLKYCHENPNEEYFVIGGAEIFKQLISHVDHLYITFIHEHFDGDTYFPSIDMKEWELISKEQGLQDEKNPYQYEFLIYKKKLII